MLVGTTGAGKTTLLRHIIGSDHVKDRFPSISTGRTTTADTEIIVARTPYRAVVTFIPEHVVRGLIDECIESACISALEGQSDATIAQALLSHTEQRFRLSYILGEWRASDADESSFDFEHAGSRSEENLSEKERVAEAEAVANQLKLQTYVARVKRLARLVGEVIDSNQGALPATANSEEKANWIEFFSEVLLDQEEFAQISLDIKDEVESRFALLKVGEIEEGPSGWPRSWSFSSADRSSFLEHVRWFTSNHSQQFGRLLTPLVNGIRISGPFVPRNLARNGKHQLMLIDGQGFGHVAEVSPSISTSVTQRLANADVILLVDSAQQPMQAAPITLLKAVASGGHGDRLAIAFTHFDQVKGDNLRTFTQKRNHVLASVRNALTLLKQSVAVGLVNLLDNSLDSKCFFLGGLDRPSADLPAGILKQLEALLALLRKPAEVARKQAIAPVFGVTGLELALRDAVDGFLRPWEARLGFGYRDGIQKEHWSRVKALSRRLAMGWGNEYDNLRPVADLVSQLQEQISRWLDSPMGWTRLPQTLAEREAALDQIRRAVFQELHKLVERRLASERMLDWRQAYNYRHGQSALKRAHKVREIYQTGAPQISSAMPPPAREFLEEIKTIVTKSVIESGGKLKWSDAA